MDFLHIVVMVSCLSSSHHLLAYPESVVFNNRLSTSPWHKTVAEVQLPHLAVSLRGSWGYGRSPCVYLDALVCTDCPSAVRKSVERILLQQTAEKTTSLSAAQLHFNSPPCVTTPIRESIRQNLMALPAPEPFCSLPKGTSFVPTQSSPRRWHEPQRGTLNRCPLTRDEPCLLDL